MDFWQILISAIAGLLSGALVSIIAPWVNWGIEQKRQKLAVRRELIASWRKMIQEITRTYNNESEVSIAQALERHEAFYSLKPHLSQNVISEIYRPRTILGGSTIGAALSYMLNEIAQLEKKWDII